jgi:putative nucleotidyltransferase with HDIG domain
MTPRVLILDPDPETCLPVIAALSSLGCQCARAGEPAAGERGPVDLGVPDVVLVGQRMPRADAVARVMALRAADPYIAVVAVTDAAVRPSPIEIQLGAGEWLVDPVGALEVAAVVVRVARQRAEDAQCRRCTDGLAATVHVRSAALVSALLQVAVRDVEGVRAVLHRVAPGHAELVRHASRVAGHAARLAAAWDLPDRCVEAVEIAGLLHDIGKLAMPELILERPGPLTDAEIAIVRTHPRVGASIVRRIGLDSVADIVLAAHERFDGRGYPGGIAGQDIPVGARMVAIADAYDALTSARLHGDPISRAAAAAEIAQAAGTRFDPHLVRVWLRRLDHQIERSA